MEKLLNWVKMFFETPENKVLISFFLIALALLIALFSLVILWYRNKNIIHLNKESPTADDANFSEFFYPSSHDDYSSISQNPPSLFKSKDGSFGANVFLFRRKLPTKNSLVELDWDKQTKVQTSGKHNASAPLRKNSEISLASLCGIILSLIYRGADDAKITQVIYYQLNEKECPFDILHIIAAIRQFMTFCFSVNCQNLYDNYQNISSPTEALLDLSHGNPASAVDILETYTETLVHGFQLSDIRQQEKISDALIQTALCLASLAAIKQPDKALVYLNNITDMESEVDDLMINSRIADIHFKLKNIHQAAVIYNQILENTPEDDANYTEMRANAKYKLALYYGDDNPQTFQWQRDSSAYLEKIGILQKLSADERQIIRIIEDNLDDNIHQIVADLASHKNNAD